MKISGNAYEFVQKHIFSPGMTIRDISVYADDLGNKSITVDYAVYMPEMSALTMNRIKSSLAVKELINRLIFIAINDKESWKDPTEGAFWTGDINTAMFFANELQKQLGGAWVIFSPSDNRYYVWSKGYYHYIGA